MKNKESVDKAIDFLLKIGLSKDDIILTGSVAIDLYGLLPDNRDINDIDLIVRVNKDLKEKFDTFIGLLKIEDTKNQYNENNITFGIGLGIKINLFVNYEKWSDEEEISNCLLTYNGIKVQTLSHIIKYKSNYNRKKDIVDITGMVQKILSFGYFGNVLLF